MNKRQYADLMESISFSISSVLNENGIDSKEKSMYEQNKLENETWKQMADRVGFTEWYKSLNRTPKDIGNAYMKARQRWLTNACKDPEVIENAIEANEKDIDFYEDMLNDYYEEENNIKINNNIISELSNQIEELKNRLQQLQNNEDNKCKLDLNTLNLDCLFNRSYLRNIIDSAKSIQEDELNMLKYINVELRKLLKLHKEGTNYKILIITMDLMPIDYFISSYNQNHTNKITEDDLYIINIKQPNISNYNNYVLAEKYIINDYFERHFFHYMNPNIKIYKVTSWRREQIYGIAMELL